MDRVTELYARTVESGEASHALRGVLAFVVLFFGVAMSIAAIPLIAYRVFLIGLN